MSNKVKVIGVRVSEDLYLKVKSICEARGEDVSDFVRRAILKELAILGFLPEEQRKALGISEKV
jgi:hypothetical protein